ncbi:lysylphosphatidylglycerol synthase domain-containing protein [Actinomadura oligospora]|uniref:lysylphosphatidylglycerol synthase domain-containing protein n=1 Tax=Actinomadura oligospora TaxID=111804 RepID=UPI00047AA713|nr:lysylphosphatidylglycerol synthase domain-containing protein [Actinomadura oligospora]
MNVTETADNTIVENIAASAAPVAPTGIPAPAGDAVPRPGAAIALFDRARTTVARSRWIRIALALVPLAAIVTALVLTQGVAHALDAFVALSDARWEFLPPLVMLSVLHYVLAAVALRGASGTPLPLRRTTLTQFTAAAANRVTPGGLGGAAVNTRYLVARGMPVASALVAVAVLQAAGAPADLLLMAGVLALGGGDHLNPHLLWPFALLLIPVVLVLLPVAVRWGRRAVRSPVVVRALTGLSDLCRRPLDLALTLSCSAGTTFVLAVAFALSVQAVPGTMTSADDTLPLLAAYLLGAAAGAAIPLPGSLGTTEAALLTALAALDTPTTPALQGVLLFRAITYWAPVPVGLIAYRTLRLPATSLAT